MESQPCALDPAVEGMIREPAQGSRGLQTPHRDKGFRKHIHTVCCENITEGELDSGWGSLERPEKGDL